MTVLPRDTAVPSQTRIHGELSLRIGPVTIAFEPAGPGTPLSLSESHEPFIVRGMNADCALRCRIAPIALNPAAPSLTSPRWDLWRDGDGGEEIVFKGPGGIPDWSLRTDRTFGAGELVQRPTDPPLPVRADAHPVLEYLVVRLLGRRGDLLLHASTAIMRERAYVFVGHSGAGKSTMASIAEAAGALIPTDDRTLVTVDRQGVWAWGTPWHGSLVRKSPDRARVAGIYLLEQASENAAAPMERNRGVMELFVRLVQPRVDSDEVRNTLSTLQAIAVRVPLFQLRFTRSAEAFDTALAAPGALRRSSDDKQGMASFLQAVPRK